MKIFKMMMLVAAILLTICSFCAHAATSYNVYFHPSWIDGKDTWVGDTIYISVVGDQYPKYYYTYSGSPTLTFQAKVEEGHEVIKWSLGDYSQQNVANARKNGCFPKHIDSKGNTLQLQLSKKDQCLAVHQDWLKYSVTFDENGGTGEMNDMENVVYTNKVKLTKNAFVRTGHTFQGWSWTKNGDVAFTDRIEVDGKTLKTDYTNKEVTLYAVWKANEYTVTFNANGGQFPAGAETSRIVTYGGTYGAFPTGLTRDGYDFANSWTNVAGRMVKSDDTMSVASNHTLYAAWTAKSAMRIDAVKRSDETGADGVVSGTGNYTWRATCHLQATPSTGSHFVKWTKNAEGGETVSTDSVYDLEVTEAATYYGHFALNSYTVTFKYKDAQGNDISTNQVVKYGQAAVPPNVTSYPHHRFDKWDTSDYKSVKGDCTVNAVYVSTVLTVTFDPNGGDPVTPEQIQLDLGDKYANLPVPTRKGCRWDGKWWTKASGGDPVTTNTEVTVTGTQTLYPHWTANVYTVTFDANGGSAPSPASVSVTYDKTYGTLPQSTRTGYTLSGWWTDRTGGEQVTYATTVKITANQTLYARWTAKTFTVNYNRNGGDLGSMDSQAFTWDKPQPLTPNAFGWTGHAFAGWSESSSAQTATYANGQMVSNLTASSSITLYAVWMANKYTVTFDANGGKGSMVPQQMTWGASQNLTSNAFVRTGYSFLGWSEDKDALSADYYDGRSVKNLTEESSITLYAVWEPKSYTIKFDANGGTGVMSNVYTEWDETVTLPAPTFIRSGYTAAGWSTNRTDAAALYVGGQEVSNLAEGGSVTLYVIWTPNHYTVTFARNGGNEGPAMADLQMTYGVAVSLPTCAYGNGIRTFGGWQGSDGKQYANGATVSNLTATANGTFTMMAQWANTYLINFDGNGQTAGTMATMKVEASATLPLSLNQYVRAGYTYLGWATNVQDAAAWKVLFTDGQEVKGLAPAGGTKTLFAVWTNNRYRVRFYPNGGEGVPFERMFTYDVAQKLPGSDAFSRKDGMMLNGWLTDPTNDAYIATGLSVSNLTATAGTTVSLFAKWASGKQELSNLAKAADSNFDLMAEPSTSCKVIYGDKGYPEGNANCIEMKPMKDSETVALKMEIKGTGKLSYYYKRDCSNEGMPYIDDSSANKFMVKVDEDLIEMNIVGKCKEWTLKEHVITNVATSIEWQVWSVNVEYFNYTVRLDGISWTPNETTIGLTYRLNDGTVAPADIFSNTTYTAGAAVGALPVLSAEGFVGWSTNASANAADVLTADWIVPSTDTQLYAIWNGGGHPVPGPGDAPTVGGFTPTVGGFSLLIASDARFDYRLLSTETLAPPDWQPDGEVKQGTGGALTFEIITEREGAPSTEFFKVEALQRSAK